MVYARHTVSIMQLEIKPDLEIFYIMGQGTSD